MKTNGVRAKMLRLLSDGEPHPVSELHELCLPSGRKAVRTNILALRKALPPGEAILCTIRNRKTYYQHVRLLASANDGRR